MHEFDHGLHVIRGNDPWTVDGHFVDPFGTTCVTTVNQHRAPAPFHASLHWGHEAPALGRPVSGHLSVHVARSEAARTVVPAGSATKGRNFKAASTALESFVEVDESLPWHPSFTFPRRE